MNHVKLLFFATIRERAGAKSLEMDVSDDLTVQGLKDKLSVDYPNLKESLKSIEIPLGRSVKSGSLAHATQGALARTV